MVHDAEYPIPGIEVDISTDRADAARRDRYRRDHHEIRFRVECIMEEVEEEVAVFTVHRLSTSTDFTDRRSFGLEVEVDIEEVEVDSTHSSSSDAEAMTRWQRSLTHPSLFLCLRLLHRCRGLLPNPVRTEAKEVVVEEVEAEAAEEEAEDDHLVEVDVSFLQLHRARRRVLNQTMTMKRTSRCSSNSPNTK